MCGEPGPDDGVDPRTFFKSNPGRRTSRKDWQLCRQVLETLSYVLSENTQDEVLGDLLVCEVAPAPDATRLLVSVRCLDPVHGPAPELILVHLQNVVGRLRSEVAASISRRKVPELIFRVVGETSAAAPEGEGA